MLSQFAMQAAQMPGLVGPVSTLNLVGNLKQRRGLSGTNGLQAA